MTRPTPNEDSKSPGLAPEVLEESQGEDRIEQRIRVPNELACWPGHFPEHPVVPGVLQVHWAMELAARWRGATPAVRRIEVLKFKQLLLPGRELTLCVSRGRRPESFHFELVDGDEIFSTGRVSTGPAPSGTTET
jgi:3-hydroxymyristoyl/3-hydroxydecanoyl-(acyl carrier protein) dehydratase